MNKDEKIAQIRNKIEEKLKDHAFRGTVQKMYADLLERSVVSSMAVMFIDKVQKEGLENSLDYLELLEIVVKKYKEKRLEIYKKDEG